jgi:WD40 repeat protein
MIESKEKVKQAQDAVNKDKQSKQLAEALTAAQVAEKKATEDADAKIKKVLGDKAFTDATNKLKGGAKDAAVKERDTAVKASADAEAKGEAAAQKKSAAAATLEVAAKKKAELENQSSVVLGPNKSTCWAVAFSPDGSLLATGSHRVGSETGKDTLKIWRVADKKPIFTPTEKKDDKK